MKLTEILQFILNKFFVGKGVFLAVADENGFRYVANMDKDETIKLLKSTLTDLQLNKRDIVTKGLA